ncbi:hypothetical protein B4102_3733 [Heyndrickxia sporothermodurans]|uniref:Helix-turn-helix domain-containing protein n=1 Tax=Heyndrickxia sporothermodurans TaxID=46224 RepID=A0A150KKW5_9BACI|nr:hypothetical protein [Heyndrickxia sporothermodurans]KYC92357.1 hypothetical protein B4102_3733 [Heyndrickxia sporothermodurans]
MTKLTVQEATSLMHSYGMKCDMAKVKQWLNEGELQGIQNNGIYTIEEDEVYKFLDAYRWKGTAYEKGIDDKTKINRLLEEIEDLKKQVSVLKEEKANLKGQLGIMPF